ncbi:Ketosteroid isomerase homolog [Nakamurella panacisegetis]|uniref:Ketosteroid isomerase homolog n=1 Tax=Nakamurella panacisegetis TaxID=1090615 RepID=A0A1H0MX51_9ACTN|nr:nuclear transport factor 2 family protein [Nakamurella panacisegetis]SDO84856.1 Ketosteroid isomerase homolog [Nakamurella panacisegetis]
MTAPAESSAQEAIWAATLDIYAGFLAADRPRIDSHLHPDGTFWDSEEAELIRGKAQLDAARDRRPAAGDGPSVVALDATDPVIDVWGDTAVARHWLTVRFDDDDVAPQHVRVTGVWRRVDGRWLAVHNHEDVRVSPR